jgi:hypothetical protein
MHGSGDTDNGERHRRDAARSARDRRREERLEPSLPCTI